MIGIMGQSVLLGTEAVMPTQNVVYPIDKVMLSNGIFDYINAIRSIYEDFPVQIPVDWVGTTIMDCTFNTLNAGDIEYMADNISKILIQRKRTDPPYNEAVWTTLFEVPINDQGNLNFTFKDITNVYEARYIYQLVPVSVQEQGGIQVEIEGTGQPTEEILSYFDGAFICDSETFIKLYAGVEYGSMQSIQLNGVHQTLGGQYPIIVTNSNVNYHTGSISGTILNTDYGQKNADGTYTQLDRQKIVQARQELDALLTSKSPKIIKDDNGNIWLVVFTDGVEYTFFNEWGRGLGQMSANWTEIGNALLGKDLTRTHIFKGSDA